MVRNRSSSAHNQTSTNVIECLLPLVRTKDAKPSVSDPLMKLTIELEEPYARELDLRAYRSGQTVKEYVEESMRTVVVADMSFDEKTALHKELAERN
jgi:hypothetical protein